MRTSSASAPHAESVGDHERRLHALAVARSARPTRRSDTLSALAAHAALAALGRA